MPNAINATRSRLSRSKRRHGFCWRSSLTFLPRMSTTMIEAVWQDVDGGDDGRELSRQMADRHFNDPSFVAELRSRIAEVESRAPAPLLTKEEFFQLFPD